MTDRKAPQQSRTGRPRAALSHQASAKIGANLQAMYRSFLDQPVPERFSTLIAQLEDRGVSDRNDGR